MAQILTADQVDFSTYLRETEASVKVRPASQFRDDLRQEFAERSRSELRAEMTSTKLRHVIAFRPSEVTCWAGYSGHRKSMFTGQLALDLCAAGQRVLMASFEMKPSRTLGRMARQCLGVGRPSMAGLDAFSRWTDGRLWIFDHLGRISPAMCLAVCRFFVEERQGTHIFIDSMMMVCASEESLDEQKQFMTDLVRLAKETGLHVHLVAHCRKPSDDNRVPTKHDIRGSAAITDQADNIALVWLNKAKRAAMEEGLSSLKYTEMQNDPDHVLVIDKQREGPWEGRMKFWFDSPSLRFMDDRTSPVSPYAIDDTSDADGPGTAE